MWSHNSHDCCYHTSRLQQLKHDNLQLNSWCREGFLEHVCGFDQVHNLTKLSNYNIIMIQKLLFIVVNPFVLEIYLTKNSSLLKSSVALNWLKESYACKNFLNFSLDYSNLTKHLIPSLIPGFNSIFQIWFVSFPNKNNHKSYRENFSLQIT